VLSPRPGQKIEVDYNGGLPYHVAVYGAARSFDGHPADFKAVDIKYDKNTRSINLALFEERRGVSVPLYLEFLYRPSMGFAPIHEVVDGRNQRIKEFYWKLWYGDDASLPDIDVRDRFVGPEVTIKVADIEQFCTIVGNQAEAFKSTRTRAVQAPMDFAIVTGWQVR
jgi:fatty acid synthase subunit beta